MPQIHSHRPKPATGAAVLAILLAGLLLAACGGSSKSSSSSSSSSGTSSTAKAPAGATGGFGARAATLRSCLQKNGVTLPARKPSQGGTPGARGPFGLGSGAQLPKGVTRAELQAALKKCSAGTFARIGRFGGAGRSQRLAKFAACMHTNGVNLPAPNTSGKGPIFNTKSIDTNSAAFKAADAKCARELTPSAPGGAGGAVGAPEAPAGGAAPAQ
jgi:hypothetical protein